MMRDFYHQQFGFGRRQLQRPAWDLLEPLETLAEQEPALGGVSRHMRVGLSYCSQNGGHVYGDLYDDGIPNAAMSTVMNLGSSKLLVIKPSSP